MPHPLLDPRRLAVLHALGLQQAWVPRAALQPEELDALLPRLPGTARRSARRDIEHGTPAATPVAAAAATPSPTPAAARPPVPDPASARRPAPGGRGSSRASSASESAARGTQACCSPSACSRARRRGSRSGWLMPCRILGVNPGRAAATGRRPGRT